MITDCWSSWLLTNDILTSRSITIIVQKTTHLTWKENLEPKLFTFTSWINTSNWNVKIHILLKNNFLRQKGYIYAQSTNTPSDFLSLAWPVITLYQKKISCFQQMLEAIDTCSVDKLLCDYHNCLGLCNSVAHLCLAVQNVENSIQQINHWPADKCQKNVLHYSLDGDLSCG